MSVPARALGLAALALALAGCKTTAAPEAATLKADTVAAAGALPKNLWKDATAETIGVTGEWSNKVDLGDVNEDGKVDILFANGGNYSSPGALQPTKVYLNQGVGQPFKDATKDLFGATDPGNHARAVRVGDLNADGHPDIVIANAYGLQSRLFLGKGGGLVTEVTATNLPTGDRSFGDVQLGDLDGDGDLDLTLVDWGPGTATSNQGGPVVVWLGDGTGKFTAAAAGAVPEKKLKMSWSLTLIDVDNDHDLDMTISCKLCTGSSLYVNDGKGKFTDGSANLPQYTNNYDFQPIDVNADGFFDLITINDGQGATAAHMLVNDGAGKFKNETMERWPPSENEPGDDNINNVLDYDNDGAPDFLTGALAGEDRLNVNDGTGKFKVAKEVFIDNDTPGTLGSQMADLNGDGRLDVAMAQGESAMPDKVFLATDAMAPDARAPVIGMVERVKKAAGMVVRARVHDNKTPVKTFDFKAVSLVWDGAGGEEKAAMTWYGEALWRGRIPAGAASYKVCATDAAGNAGCSEVVQAAD